MTDAPAAPVAPLADMDESTMDTLVAPHLRWSPPPVFRARHDIGDAMHPIDGSGVFRRRAR